MPRIRGLKPDFFKDEDLATLPFECRILFEGLWCYADKKGRMEDRPKYLKAEIFPYDKIDIEKVLNLLACPNLQDRPKKIFIRRYSVNGSKYIDIPEFLTHQTPHHTEKESIIPEFNGEITVNSPSIERENKEDTVQIPVQDTVLEKEKDRVHPAKVPPSDGAFSIFWESYPRKQDKGHAEKAWKKINPDKELSEKICAAICEQNRTKWNQTEKKFIPLASTWLNGQRWEDEIEQAQSPQPRTNTDKVNDCQKSRPRCDGRPEKEEAWCLMCPVYERARGVMRPKRKEIK